MRTSKLFLMLMLVMKFIFMSNYLHAQITPINTPSTCANADFSKGDFTNWVGRTSVYPYNTPDANISSVKGAPAYYMNTGIVPGRHTIITQSLPDPFTCGNVLTLPPGEKTCVRLGNGGKNVWDGSNAPEWANSRGVEWQRDFLDYTFSITPSNALLIYKYAVVLQDPAIEPHSKNIRPRFIVSIKDQNGNYIDPVCGYKEDFADATVFGYRNCSSGQAAALGGQVADPGDIVYRAWTTVGVDLRKYIGQNITLGFETWDCGKGGHFGYAYLTAKCDSLAILMNNCNTSNTIKLTAPDGFSYKWLPGGQTTRSIFISNVNIGDSAKVELTTLTGCKTVLSAPIYPTIIKANFTFKDACLNQVVNFTDSSYSYLAGSNGYFNIPIIDWKWRFGDGSTATGKNASHTYTIPGEYPVTLIITNKSECIDSVTKIIKILPGPTADFTFKNVCTNETAYIKDLSSTYAGTPIVSGWKWSISDNNTTYTTQNPSHIFTKSGTYTISLQVSDLGCVDDTTKTIEIFASPTPNFAVSNACVGDSTKFTDKSIKGNPIDDINGWIWDFGDTTAFSGIQNTAHKYKYPGLHTATLIVKSQAGCIASLKMDVLVKKAPKPNFTALPVCLNTPITFVDITMPQGSVAEWAWKFGDRLNSSSNEESPTFIYDSVGIYYPKLTITSIQGCRDSVTIPLNIPPPPKVNFNANKYEGCVPLCTSFKDLSFSILDSITTWKWNFGDDKGYSNIQHPDYCYRNEGIYSVTLSVTTANTCKNSYTWIDMIHAFPTPTAKFSFTPEKPNEIENVVSFYDESIGANSWTWDFGNGNGSEKKNPEFTFNDIGKYPIILFVKNEYSCTDSTYKEIIIQKEWSIYVPNTFTPNKDGKNDTFMAKGTNITEFQMIILDRWGDVVYDTGVVPNPDMAQPWDGRANNGKKPSQQDTYVWVVKLKDIKGKFHKYIGHVNIVR